MLRIIDMHILNGFQKFSDQVQLWTGITCFMIGKMLVILCAIGLVIELMGSIGGFMISFMSLITFLCFLGTILLYISITRSEEQIKSDPNFCNKRAISESDIRSMYLIFVPFIIYYSVPEFFTLWISPESIEAIKDIWGYAREMGSSIFALFFLPSLYFAACTPKPHQPSKIRKMVEGWLQSANISMRPA